MFDSQYDPIKARVNVLRGLKRENLAYTPIGKLNPAALAFMEAKGYLVSSDMPRLYLWQSHKAYLAWEAFRNDTLKVYFQKSGDAWRASGQDLVLTAMSKKCIITPKITKTPEEWRKICEAIEPTQQELDLQAIMLEIDNRNKEIEKA